MLHWSVHSSFFPPFTSSWTAWAREGKWVNLQPTQCGFILAFETSESDRKHFVAGWHRLYVRTQSTFNVIQEANCSLRADRCHGNELLLCEWRILFWKNKRQHKFYFLKKKKKTKMPLKMLQPSCALLSRQTQVHLCINVRKINTRHPNISSSFLFLKRDALVSVTNILFCAPVKIPETRQLKGTLYQSGVFRRPPSVLCGWGDKTGS